MKNQIFIGALCLCMTACGGTATVSNINTNSASNSANTTNQKPAAPANTNANKPANTNTAAAKPEESGPKRISFAKGKTETTENITLAPGKSVQFILGATGAQTLFITPGSDDLTFRIVKGIAGELIKGDDGMYSAETKGNNAQKGEIVFEVKNPTDEEIKTTVKIAIEDFAD